MAIYVITDELGVESYKNWWHVKQSSGFEKEQFSKMGNDYVLFTDKESYQVALDKKALERVATSRVFQKDGFTPERIIMIVVMIFSLLAYFSVGSLNSKVDVMNTKIIEQVKSYEVQ